MSDSFKMQPSTPPLVEIRSGDYGDEVYIDGKKIDYVESFSLEYDPMKNLNPMLTLRVRACNFCITSHAVPLLPAPWSWFYELKEECKGMTDAEHLEAMRAEKNQSED